MKTVPATVHFNNGKFSTRSSRKSSAPSTGERLRLVWDRTGGVVTDVLADYNAGWLMLALPIALFGFYKLAF